jgi:NAD(P)-dependent dehydrogenase (short-subunit alcohol dehydrogenase family)
MVFDASNAIRLAHDVVKRDAYSLGVVNTDSHVEANHVREHCMTDLPNTPSFRLDGKRALITGGGRGIGLACAAALADAGAHVTITARKPDEIEAVAQALNRRGQKADAVTVDVTDVPAMQKLIGAADPFDILVNNAGGARHGPALEATEIDFDFVASMNLKAAYFAAQAVARGLVAAKKPGSLIHITSQMAHVGGPNRSVYCGTKWGVEGFSKAMAIEFGPHQIRSNTIAPTFIMTEMVRGFFDDPQFKDWVLGKIKLGRVGRLEDLMGPVVFLASDASALMTGTSLLVDGGWTAE